MFFAAGVLLVVGCGSQVNVYPQITPAIEDACYDWLGTDYADIASVYACVEADREAGVNRTDEIDWLMDRMRVMGLGSEERQVIWKCHAAIIDAVYNDSNRRNCAFCV